MVERSLVDAAERASALDITKSFIVQAPAGSGKTTLLTQRFLRLLASTDVPESIIAITFSRKAAEEMRARIVGALAAAHDLDEVTAKWARAARANAQTRQWDLDADPRRLRILTIDALAQLIVRRHPLLAGGTGAQQVVEDASGLYAQAARQTIEEIATGSEWSSAVSRIATHLDNNWSRLENLLSNMLATRDQWLRPVVSDPTRESIERVLANVVSEALAPLGSQIAQFDCAAELVEICQFCGTNVASSDSQSPIAGLREMPALPTSDVNDLPLWRGVAELLLTKEGKPRKQLNKNLGLPPKDEYSTRLKQALKAFIAEADTVWMSELHGVTGLPDPSFSDDAWENLSALFTVLKLAAANLGLVFQQTGMVDFTEIALSALNTLGAEDAPSDASLLLDHQIDHLLIDEFQDTSVIQYQLIQRLIAGWSADQQRSLFLVGDPKQSIYRFRQADVSRFTETFNSGRFGQVPLEALHLRANFRSAPQVIDWINEAEEKMASADARFPASPPLSAVQSANPAANVAVHQLTKTDSSGSHVVELVHSLRRDAIQDAATLSIAVLVRNRSHLKDITKQLTDAGITLLATDIDKLLTQPVVSDLWALTRALLHPADATAWLAILRAPWLGLSLTELSHIAMVADDAVIATGLNKDAALSHIEPANRERFHDFNIIMQRGLQSVGRQAISDVVAQTWHALRGSEFAVTDGVYHYVERYFLLLDEFESREGQVNATAFEQFLDTRYVSPRAESGEAVQVMTIHKAKGLEFDVVILPGLNQGSRAEDKPLLRWQATANDELLMSLLPASGDQDHLYDYLHSQEKQAAELECYRLLYVALTRAKQQLHLLCEVDDEVSEPRSGSLQRLLWPALVDQISIVEDDVITAGEVAEPTLVQRPVLRRIRDALLPERISPAIFSAPEPGEELEFSWAGSSAKYIGTVTHDILQLLGDIGWPQFVELWQASHQQMVSRRLIAIGIEPEKLTQASQKVAQAIDTVLQSSRAQWLFDNEHRDAHSELPLSAIIDGEAVNVILDRTFSDANGVRWIIDFKTSEHLETDLAGFLDIQVERYQPQLARYAEIYSLIKPMPTKLALYFPLHDAWREWDFDSSDVPR